MIIDLTQTVVPKTYSIFRLKSDFIVHYDIAKDKYFQIRNGNDSCHVFGFWCLGDKVLPLWNQKVYVDKAAIAYELKFRPGDLVKNNAGHLMKICTIPSNCGGGDYGRWILLKHGKFSGSGQEHDPDLYPAGRQKCQKK